MRFRRLTTPFALPEADPDLACAQFKALSNQIPILYGILLINAVGLAATHIAVAPRFLTIVIPTVLCVGCVARVALWLRNAHVEISGAQAIKRLRATILLAVVLGMAFTAWSLSLYPYGDAFAKCHVAYYMSITVISCIFCLMHLRAAALLLTAIVIVPFTIFFCFAGQMVLAAIALNFALVACGMVFILLRNYRDFASLVVSERELRSRQAEAERLSEENLRLANLDSLTGLPNRRRFLATLDETLCMASAGGTRFAVALVDLDGFKGVNDVHGHATGDRLLAEVGDRLAAIATPGVFAARLGGDEFGIILAGDPDDDAIRNFGESVCRRLRGPYLGGNITSEVTGSAGIVTYPNSADSAELLFERADYALYHAKEWRNGCPVIFSAEHETMIRNASRIEHALRKADLARELSVVFQPIVDAGSGTTIGFEALARWASPELGLVGPDVFIATAEKMGVVGRLTETLLAMALTEAAGWPETMRLSFNLSAQDVSSADTMAAIRRIIAQSGMTPSRIDLEITETAIMRDFAHAREALAALRRLGVQISLDDFGTGFSSLSQVHRLQLDTIKIDRSFVADLLTNEASADVVRTIVGLCRNLDVACIVEGVETEAQRRRLQSLGCRFMQGYLFARPMPACDLLAYLKASAAERQYA